MDMILYTIIIMAMGFAVGYARGGKGTVEEDIYMFPIGEGEAPDSVKTIKVKVRAVSLESVEVL